MATLKVEILSNEASLFDSDRRFLALGKLKAGGDIFIPFISLETGKIYVEEAFATVMTGQSLVGLAEIKDDKLWGALIQASMQYKLIAPRHIADCLHKLGLKLPLVKASLIATAKDDLEYMKKLGVVS